MARTAGTVALDVQTSGSTAPAYTARTTIERFNCLACHSRDGAGGMSSVLSVD